MAEPQLEVTDVTGHRTVAVDKLPFRLGRGAGNDLLLTSGEVSRVHAEIVAAGEGYAIRDCGSRHGTFVDGAPVREGPLEDGARVRLGRGGAELTFRCAAEETTQPPSRRVETIGDLRQVAVLLEGLRALSSARVLDDVLVLVMDSAIAVSGAERGFIMLADDEGPARVHDGAVARPAAAARQRLPDQPQDPGGSVPDREDAHRGRSARRRPRGCAPGNRGARDPPRAVRAAAPGALHRRCGDRCGGRAPRRRALSRQPGEGDAARLVDRKLARDAGERGRGRHRERQALPGRAREGAPRPGDADRGRHPAGPAPDAPPDGGLLRGGGGDPAVPGHRRRLLRLLRPWERAGWESCWATWRGRGRPRRCSAPSRRGRCRRRRRQRAAPDRRPSWPR